MAKHRRPILLFAIAITMAASALPALAQSQDDVDEARDRLLEERRLLEEQRDELHVVEHDLEAAVLAYEEINTRLEDAAYRVAVTRDRVEEFEGELRDLRHAARDLTVDAYMLGDPDFLFFEAEDFNALITGQEVMARASEKHQIRLDRLTVTKRELDRLRAQFEADQEEEAQYREDADLVVRRVEELLIRRAEFVEAQRAVVGEADAAYQEAVRLYEEERLRRRLAEIARLAGAAAGIPGGEVPGLTCPVAGPTAFINSWGFPRSGGRTHKGTDMFAPRGTPLVAVGDGVVTLSSNRLGGLTVWLHTDVGIAYYYAHLDAYGPVNSGQRVSKGTTIGTVGNSGNARFTSPHLHIQMHPGGRSASAVNPYPTMVYACG